MRLLAVAAVGLVVALAAPAATREPTTALVSLGYRGAWSNGGSLGPLVSGNGRFVAFHSWSTNLVRSRRKGIFLRDRRLRRTQWLSPSGNGYLGIAAMTPSARYILLCTPTALAPPDVPPKGREDWEIAPYNDAYVYDRRTRRTIRASVPVRGRNPNEWACFDTRTADLSSAISDDGRRVAFQAGASNLVRGDTNRMSDIFVRDLDERDTYRVPIPGRINQPLRGPMMSGNGRFVFYGRQARIQGRRRDHVYMHDLRTRRTTLISTAPNRRPLSNGGYILRVSTSGRFVLIGTNSPEVVGDLENARTTSQLFVKDLKTGTYDLLTRGIDGKGLANGPETVAMSADARYVAFSARDDNVVPGDTNRVLDVFWLDRRRDQIVRLNLRADGAQSMWLYGHRLATISADGRWVAWSSSDPEFWPGEPRRPSGYETEDVFIHGPMH